MCPGVGNHCPERRKNKINKQLAPLSLRGVGVGGCGAAAVCEIMGWILGEEENYLLVLQVIKCSTFPHHPQEEMSRTLAQYTCVNTYVCSSRSVYVGDGSRTPWTPTPFLLKSLR
jgi:hypothetical protein